MKRMSGLLLVWSLVFVSWSFSAHAEFGDLPTKHPYHRGLNYLQQKGLINGYDDNTVRADAPINRAEFLKLLLEGFDIPLQAGNACFTDINGSEWFATYVCTAKSKGIVDGLPDGSFQAWRNINKAESLKIIINVLGIPQKISTSRFSDVKGDAWFSDFVTTAEQGNFLEEQGSQFSPASNYSRGQIAEILYRILSAQDNNQTIYTGTETPRELSENEQQLLQWQLFALDHINQLRAENGVAPIKMNPLLNEVARIHSEDMARNIKAMSHDGSRGEQAHERIKQGKVPNLVGEGFNTLRVPDKIGWSGENVGMRNIWNFGGSGEAAIKNQHEWFMDEPEDIPNHRTTMLSTLYPFSEVGIGLSLDEQGNLWITEDYISRLE